MKERPEPTTGLRPGLDQISTQWSAVGDPVQFTMRYAPAIEAYLEALIKNRHDAEEVLQDFLVRGLQKGFVRASPLRGRFRDYLKTAVRNAAIDHLRRRRLPQQGKFDLGQIAAVDSPTLEEAWVSEWRRCLLDRAWEALHRHQRCTPGNQFHTVLRLSVEEPEADSAALAARTAELAGRPVSPAAFRKQVSRARRLFAELLVQEVAQTLTDATPQRIEEELIDIGLMSYVREFLPS
jgi:RNA polymerase sigma-70 factor (ECF subfamily)